MYLPSDYASKCKITFMIIMNRYLNSDLSKSIMDYIDFDHQGLIIAMRVMVKGNYNESFDTIKNRFQKLFMECTPEPKFKNSIVEIYIPAFFPSRILMDINTLTWKQKYMHVLSITMNKRDKCGRPIVCKDLYDDLDYCNITDSWICWKKNFYRSTYKTCNSKSIFNSYEMYLEKKKLQRENGRIYEMIPKLQKYENHSRIMQWNENKKQHHHHCKNIHKSKQYGR